MQKDRFSDISIATPFQACAIYYHDADRVEYVRRDVTSVHRRIDENLSLILDFHSRKPVGFHINGFKALYLTEFKAEKEFAGEEFLALVHIIERLVGHIGDALWTDRLRAYQSAHEIAKEDSVELRDLPKAA